MSSDSGLNPTTTAGSAPETTSPAPQPGLRERNKARTRRAIRAAALQLFQEQGYAATTVAQIAALAEVSHTTLFRYFETKEQIVLRDDIDDSERVALIRKIPPGLGRFDLVRQILNDMYDLTAEDEWASNPARFRLIQSDPKLFLASQVAADKSLGELTGAIADYLGTAPDDHRLRVFIGAVIGAIFHHWTNGAGEIPTLRESLAAIDLLEDGLPV